MRLVLTALLWWECHRPCERLCHVKVRALSAASALGQTLSG